MVYNPLHLFMSLFLPDSHLKKSSTLFLKEESFPSESEWARIGRNFSSFPKIADAMKSSADSTKFSVVNRNRRICCIFVGLLIFLVFMIGGVCLSSLSVLPFNGLALGLALSVPFILGIGGLLIFLRAAYRRDVFTHRPLGINPGRPISVSNIGVNIQSPSTDCEFKVSRFLWYLDSSGLDENGNGIVGAYICPSGERADRFSVVFSVTVLMPFFVLGVMVYNLFRSLIIPFYIFYKMIQERKSTIEDKFRLIDVPREILRSLFNVVKSPFYGIGMIFSLFYSLIEPYSGRILTGAIERDWNDDVSCDRGYIFCDYQSLHRWQWEGGGKRSLLGQNATYLMECCQPRFFFLFKQGRVVSGSRSLMTQAENSYRKDYYAYVWNCVSDSSESSESSEIQMFNE